MNTLKYLMLILLIASCGGSAPVECEPVHDGPCAALEIKNFCGFTCTCVRAGTWATEGECSRR